MDERRDADSADVLDSGKNDSPPDSSSASSSSSEADGRLDLLAKLPEDCLQSVLAFFSTYDLLVHLEHGAPCRAWRSFWHESAAISLDLERDVGQASARADVALTPDEQVQARMDVARRIARKRHEYTRVIQLLAKHARDLQELTLDNFGSVLNDLVAQPTTGAAPSDVPAAGIASAESASSSGPPGVVVAAPALPFTEFLSRHAHSLVSLSLVAASLHHLVLGDEFSALTSLNLEKCKELTAPSLRLPSLTHLDCSRTLLNDFELLKLLPGVPKLRVLRLAGAKNIRCLDGPTAERLFTQQVPDLRVVDLSGTHCVDASVNALTRYCASLRALHLNDCFDLRSPKILSHSLEALSMRQCNRLMQTMRIVCPRLRELDLGKAQIKDSMVNGDGSSAGPGTPATGQIHVPNIEMIMLRNCYELFAPTFRNAPTAAVEQELNRVCYRRPKEEEEEEDEEEDGGLLGLSSRSPSRSGSVDPGHLPSQVYPRLHTIDLSMCFGFTNHALTNLLEMAPSVTYLNLQQCKEVRPVYEVRIDAETTEERRDLLPGNLTQLQELCLRGCAIEDENIRLLMDTVSAAHLTSLNLRNCAGVSGRYLRGVHLVTLDLRLTQLTDALLVDLLRDAACPNLAVLYAGQCDQLVHVEVRHARLVHLDLSNCAHLRTVEVDAPALEHIDASLNLACTRIDVQRCTRLRTINVHFSAQCEVVRRSASADGELASVPAILTSPPDAALPQERAAAPQPLYAYPNSKSMINGIAAHRTYEEQQAQRHDLSRRALRTRAHAENDRHDHQGAAQ